MTLRARGDFRQRDQQERSSEVGEEWGGRKNWQLLATGSAAVSVREAGSGQASFTSLKSFGVILYEANGS